MYLVSTTPHTIFSSPIQSTRRAIAVTPAVRVSVTLRQSFICKFFKSSYLDSHSSESIQIWTIGTLEGQLSFHDSWLQGWCPGVGLEVKIYDTFKKCFSTFLLWNQLTRQIVGWTSVSLVTLTYGSWSEGHHDLYFMVQWFCLTSWSLFDIWTPYFGIMSQYDPMFDLKIIVGHCDLYFMVQWFCLVSWRLFDVWTSYFRIMSQYDLTFNLKNKCRSLWPIFHGPVTLLYISKTICCMNIILQDYESVWHNIWPQNKCRSLWPIFHGLVILPYILKTIWYMNTILGDYESVWPDVWPKNKCRSLWPIFHGQMILPYILKTIQ